MKSREQIIWEMEDSLLPEAERDCPVCRGERCGACAKSGKLMYYVILQQQELKQRAKRIARHREEDGQGRGRL